MRMARLSLLIIIATLLLVACRQTTAEKKAYTPAESVTEGNTMMVAEGTSPTEDTESSELAETEQAEVPQDDEAVEDSSGEEQEAAEDAPSETDQPDESPEDDVVDEPQDAEKIEKIPASQLPSRMINIVKVMFETNKGSFIIAIYPEIAPLSAPHFIMLIREGFYDRIAIHRYEPGFVVQMGKAFDDDGIPLYPDHPRKAELAQITIADEPCLSENTDMTISFAKPDAPDSASCQFFINLGDNRRLDELNYGFTVMAQVVHGQNVVRSLRVGDEIGSAQIIERDLDPSL